MMTLLLIYIRIVYDSETGTSPSVIYFPSLAPHATHVAGIIGAVKDNGKDIAGVAPDCKLMSISNPLNIPDFASTLADGFNWAVQNGADVINNSWGDDPYNAAIRSALLENAIDNALFAGRSGRGIPVFFSAGNSHSGSPVMGYPCHLQG